MKKDILMLRIEALIEKLTEHSKKPNIFYEILESNTPEPRIELFARNKRDGWDVWGNEVENDITL